MYTKEKNVYLYLFIIFEHITDMHYRFKSMKTFYTVGNTNIFEVGITLVKIHKYFHPILRNTYSVFIYNDSNAVLRYKIFTT